MAFIGAAVVTVWKGVLVPAFQEFNLIKAPGVDGFGVVMDAFRAPPQIIRTVVTVGSLDAANAIVSSYRRIAGPPYSPVQVVDQFGFNWPGTIPLRAECDEDTWIQNTIFGYRIATRWTLLVQSVRP